MLPEGTVDAISGYASSAMPSYVATGVKAHFMLFSDYGILNYGTTVMTQPNRVAEEPQLCAAFVDGIMRGLKATLLDPKEAIKVAHVAAREVIKTNGMGYMEPNDYESMTDLVMKYVAKEGDQRPDVRKMMTNQFVGDHKPSPAEWDQMQKNTHEFRTYLRLLPKEA